MGERITFNVPERKKCGPCAGGQHLDCNGGKCGCTYCN